MAEAEELRTDSDPTTRSILRFYLPVAVGAMQDWYARSAHACYDEA
jgi:hypothetical protein